MERELAHRVLSGGLAAAVALLAPATARAQAESYEPIRVLAGLVGGYTSGLDGAGFGGMVEPSFLLRDDLAVGLRLEGMVTFGFGADDIDLGSGSLTAVLAKAQYLVGDHAVRPFAAAAIGMYSIGGQDISSSDEGLVVDGGVGRHLGVAVQAGIDLGRVRLAASYNAIVGADVEIREMLGSSSIRRFSHDYITFELSFVFGGTKKTPAAAEPPGAGASG